MTRRLTDKELMQKVATKRLAVQQAFIASLRKAPALQTTPLSYQGSDGRLYNIREMRPLEGVLYVERSYDRYTWAVTKGYAIDAYTLYKALIGGDAIGKPVKARTKRPTPPKPLRVHAMKPGLRLIYSPATEETHVAAPSILDTHTLCGVHHFRPDMPGKMDVAGPVTCKECRLIVEYVHNHRNLRRTD